MATCASKTNALPFGLLVLGISCNQPSTEPTQARSSPVALASMSAAKSAAPKMLPYRPTPEERLGVLAPNTGIARGQKVPDAHAVDLQGKDVSLSSLYQSNPILLAFYRGGWCPYCNTEIHALTTAYPEYQKRGIVPVAVSVDRPDIEGKLKATYTIPFPVLSDSSAAMLMVFHVVRKVGDQEFAEMKAFGIDLEKYSGVAHHQIAIPALFLIDREGIVRWAHSDPDYKVRPTTPEILAAIDAAKLGS